MRFLSLAPSTSSVHLVHRTPGSSPKAEGEFARPLRRIALLARERTTQLFLATLYSIGDVLLEVTARDWPAG